MNKNRDINDLKCDIGIFAAFYNVYFLTNSLCIVPHFIIIMYLLTKSNKSEQVILNLN